ncbi:MAG: GNAT family N-acetyltransferase [Bacteroidales bacterium]|nr:GNAT family N-acetyltransferase [Bacteroidales bacterium]
MVKPKITITPATPNDIHTIYDFIHEMAIYEKCEEDFVTDEKTLYTSLFEQHAAECLLIREDGCDSVVGFAIFFHNFSTFVGRRGLYIEELYIVPEKRGKGYGTAMLHHLAQIAVERNCGRMEWICIDWNEPALSVYRSIGAIPMDEWTIQRMNEQTLKQFAQSE